MHNIKQPNLQDSAVTKSKAIMQNQYIFSQRIQWMLMSARKEVKPTAFGTHCPILAVNDLYYFVILKTMTEVHL